jgi:phosphate:Na+ symporter
MVFSFCGGLAIFLFGIGFMSDGLKNIGSNTFRQILKTLTKNRISAIIVGAGITCLIQSSSATSVMVVGFVNAGLLKLTQAIAVVLGADVGTTITAWLVSVMGMGKFQISAFSLPIIAVGFFISCMGRKRNTQIVGQCLLGFGFLFMGLGIMSEGMESLKESHYVNNFFARFGSDPFLGIVAGMVVTIILQSSSVTIAIIQVMALNGLLGIDSALGLILGSCIGTTITAQLAALGGTKNAKSVAMGNTLFKVMGAVIFFPFLLTGWFEWLIRLLVPDSLVMVQIAAANTIFNLVTLIIFTTFLWPFLIKCSKLLTFGGTEEIDREAKFLDPLLLKDPSIAMQQVVFELIRMTELAQSVAQDAKTAFFSKKGKKVKSVKEKEEVIDELQRSITSYLIQISARDLNTRESMAYPVLLHCVNDIEKVGDYAVDIVEYAEEKNAKKLILEYRHTVILDTMFSKLDEIFNRIITSLKEKDSFNAYDIIEMDHALSDLKTKCRKGYIKRLNNQKTNPQLEMFIMDTASAVKKMSDHLANIASAVINDLQWGKKVKFRENV